MEKIFLAAHRWLKDVLSIPVSVLSFVGFWAFLLGWAAAYEGVPHVLLFALALLGLALALTVLAYLPMFPIWAVRALRRKQESRDGESRWPKLARRMIASRETNHQIRYDQMRGRRQTGRALARRRGSSGW